MESLLFFIDLILLTAL